MPVVVVRYYFVPLLFCYLFIYLFIFHGFNVLLIFVSQCLLLLYYVPHVFFHNK